MKKKIMLMLLALSILGCNSKNDIEEKKSVEKTNKVEQKQVNILSEENMKTLKKIGDSLNVLEKYSTEINNNFYYPNEPLWIINNEYIFNSYVNEKLMSRVKIDLKNLELKIQIKDMYQDGQFYTFDYKIYKEIIDKAVSFKECSYTLNPTREMELRILNDFFIKNEEGMDINAFSTIEINKDYSRLVIKTKDSKEIISIDFRDINSIYEGNSKVLINNIVSEYSQNLLRQIVNLGQKYKRFRNLLENAEAIANHPVYMELTDSYVQALEYNEKWNYGDTYEYYANGRISKYNNVVYQNKSLKDEINEKLDKLENLLKNVKTALDLDYNLNNEILTLIHVEDLNVNKTEEDKENLKAIKDRAKKLFEKVDELEKYVEYTEGGDETAVFYPSGKVKIYLCGSERVEYDDNNLTIKDLKEKWENEKKVNGKNSKFDTYLMGLTWERNITDERLKELNELITEVQNYKNN